VGHDPAQAQVFCYSAVTNADAITEELKGLAPKWRDVARISDQEIESYVRGDQIDILVDLAGHTSGSRVFALSRRIAPVQISYLGYPNTTGIPAIDYRIVDSLTDPQGAEQFYTEKLIRLDPCFLCYQPPAADLPDVKAPPSAVGARITFGSFNSAQKLVEPVVAAWSALLKEIPGSRLLLKSFAFDSAPTRRDFLKHFEQQGIAADRIEIRGSAESRADHLAAYHDVDIALDTFPYCGTTTTCEALLMGVPVVTLEGRTHAGRVGVSLLTNIGLPELIATSIDDYLQKAVSLARDPARIAALRPTLRDRLLRSPLCDAPKFMRRLESAYREAWRHWCRDNPATH
jgi:predicted O-linked N-acetylglucosamine transferase (SPINDLY family)